MVTDLFHIVPTDGYVNGQRSSWPFGETSNAQWTSMNGSKRGSNSTSGYSGTIFEPIDEYKGDFARIYFYMATRYENIISSWEDNSSSADAALDGTTFPVFEEWYLNLLLDWHNNDPLSQKEIDRNNAIYDIQNNRNPFVDHEEWVNLIWSDVQAPVITNVVFSPQNPNENEAVNVTATITDDGTIMESVLQWGYSSSNLSNILNMSSSASTYSAQIPGQSAGQQVYFRIEATDNESNTTLTTTYNYQVNQNAGTITLPFTEDFNDETLGIFYEYSVSGDDQYWHNNEYEGSYYAKMSNYNGSNNVENEDWIITPAINFNAYSNEVLNFSSAMKDYSDNTTFIYLLYSTNYSGTGDPNSATWVDISAGADWSAGEYVWTTSGDVSLSALVGEQVYIAFKYDSQSSSGKTWQIDDVSISIGGDPNVAPVISNVSYSPTSPSSSENVTVAAEITDDVSVASATVYWGLSSSSLSNSVNMTASGDNYSAIIPNQDAELTVYFKIQAVDGEGLTSETGIYQYTVEADPNQAPEIANVNFSPSSPSSGQSVNVEAEITDDVSVATATVYWGLSSSNLSNSLSMGASGDNYSAIIPGQSAGLTVYFKIQAVDNEGLTSETGIYQYTVEADPNQAPVITNISFSPTSPSSGQSVNVEAEITDDVSVASATVYWGLSSSNLSNSLNMSASGNNYSAIIPGQSAGITVYFKIQAIDNEGLTTETGTYQYTVESDPNQAPEISNVNYSPTSPSSGQTVNVEAEITDDVSVASATVYWGLSSSSLSNSVNMTASGDDYSAIIPNQDAELTVYFKIQAVDGEGLTSETGIYQYTVEADPNQAPEIANVNFSPSSPSSGQSVNVEAEITDDVSVATATVYWGLSSSNLSNSLSMGASGDNYSAIIPGQSAGLTVYFKIQAVDNEGLTSETGIYQYTVEADPNQAPVITNISFSPTSPSSGQSVNVEAEITDDVSVASATVYWGLSSSNLSNSLNMSASGNNYSAIIPGQSAGITVYFKIQAIDNEGLTTETGTYQYTVESDPNQAPEISNVNYSPTSPSSGQTVNVEAEITDDVSVASATVYWGLSSSNLTNSLNMNASGSNYSAIIPGQAEELTVYFKIQAVDDEGLATETEIYQYTVESDPNQAPEISNVTYSPTSPSAGESVTVEAEITDDVFVVSAIVLWGYSSSLLEFAVPMSGVADLYSASILGQDAGVSVYFKVIAFDDDDLMTESDILQYTVEVGSGTLALPFMENFENEDLGLFNSYSVTGPNETWHNDEYDDNLFAEMSNYNGNENIENEDWMISPPINFDAYSNEILHFRSAMNDYSDVNTFLYLKISTNYDGISDPNTATWTNLSDDAFWSLGDFEWIESGGVNLSMITGNEVYLAFQYVSQAGTGKTWQLDNISITLDGGTNMPPEIANITQTPEEPNNLDEVVVTAQIIDDDFIQSAQIYFGTSASQMNETVEMSGSGNDYSGSIPPQEAYSTIYYRIKAIDSDDEVSYSSIYSYFVDLVDGVEKVENTRIIIYPNPAKDYMQVNAVNILDQMNMKIFQSSGDLVMDEEIYSQDRVDISQLAPGYYLVQITSGNYVRIIALVICK